MRLTIFLLFIFSLQSYSQTDTSSQLSSEPTLKNYEILLEMTNFTSVDFIIAEKLFSKYRNASLDTCKLVAEKIVEISQAQEGSINHGKSLTLLGHALTSKGKYIEAEKQLQKSKEIGLNINSEELVAEANYRLGRIENKRDQYDLAVDYFLEAITSYEKLKDSSSIFNTYFNIAGIYYNLKISDKTEEYTKKATLIAEALDNKSMKMQIYKARSVIFSGLSHKYRMLGSTDSLKKDLYLDSLYHFSALEIESLKNALLVAEENQDKQSIAYLLIQLLGSYNNSIDYESALKYGLQAKSVLAKLGDENLNSRYNSFMAITYMETGKSILALKYAKESLAVAEELGRERKIAKSHNYLHLVYEEIGNYKKAFEHLGKFQSYLDKINDLDKNKIIAEAETKFQTAEKEKQILTQENEILGLETSNAKVEKQRNYIIGLGLLFGILAFFGIRMGRLQKDRNDKKAFSEALIIGQEEERKKIARDLHDGIGQSLLLIKKQMEKSNDTVSQNQVMISDTLEEVRSLSRDLHPFQLDKFGLTSTVEGTIQKVSSNTNLFISKELPNIDNLIPKSSAIHVYRTIQEALSNIVKHAEATAAKVAFSINNKGTLITVQDNGKGFDPELTISKSNSLGLKTMQERISTIGGKFKIEKGASNGTVISIFMPKI